MRLSIITINYNNASGLRKTLASVASQTYPNIEHIIIDGGSTDGSVDIIKEYEEKPTPNKVLRTTIGCPIEQNSSPVKGREIKWVSEKDHGIYHAMNKGIEIALGRRIVNADHTSSIIGDHIETNECVSHGESGGTCHLSIKRSGIDHCDLVAERDNRSELVEDKFSEADQPKQRGVENKVLPDYVQILNSGDIFADPDVVERMVAAIEKAEYPELLYGNMIKKDFATEKVIGKSGEVEFSLRQYFTSTMNHDCCYFRRDMFDKYGLYDESLKICSDWKWFLQAIGLGNVKPVYANIDVTIFDASGISETNLDLRKQERRQILEQLLPPAVLVDYDKHAFEMEQMNRMRKHHMYSLVYFMERVLNKFERWKIIK